jgi:CheY-like chemotaxis protein
MTPGALHHLSEPKPSTKSGDVTMRVLVVDPYPDTVESLVLLLNYWGHEAHGVGDGLAALQAALVYQPDVVVTDVALPGLDGYEVARRLRHQQGSTALRLVALTACDRDVHRRCALEAGFDAFLVKPVAPDVLRDLLVDGNW